MEIVDFAYHAAIVVTVLWNVYDIHRLQQKVKELQKRNTNDTDRF